MVETESCNLEPCKILNTEWSECSATCGTSYKERILNGRVLKQLCQTPVCVNRVTTTKQTKVVTESTVLSEEDIYMNWSSWSRCSRQCGGEGVQKRTRYKN